MPKKSVLLIVLLGIVGSSFAYEQFAEHSEPLAPVFEPRQIAKPRKKLKLVRRLLEKPLKVSLLETRGSDATGGDKPSVQIESDKSKPSQLTQQLVDEGLDEKLLSPWFAGGEPAQVNLWKNGERLVIKNKPFPSGNGKGTDQTLYLADQDTVSTVVAERQRQSDAFLAESPQTFQSQINSAPQGFTDASGSRPIRRQAEKADAEDNQPQEEQAGSESKRSQQQSFVETSNKLPSDAYEVVGFLPGLRDDKKTQIKSPRNLEESARGPDHYWRWVDPKDQEALRHLRDRTISLGHSGEITLKVANGGYIADGAGFDFAVYENPFRFGEGKVYLEFAAVGVAMVDKDDAYVWFPCDPAAGVTLNCSGMVPTDEGGDRFDLATLGIERIRFIKIRDVGTNFSNFGKNTEGFDFDAIELLNAYPEEK